MGGVWKQLEEKIPSCETCLQPIDESYMFTVSWIEDRELISKKFCGSSCLRNWVDEHSENVKLALFNP